MEAELLPQTTPFLEESETQLTFRNILKFLLPHFTSWQLKRDPAVVDNPMAGPDTLFLWDLDQLPNVSMLGLRRMIWPGC